MPCRAQWFERDEGSRGMGITGVNLQRDLQRRVLSPELFPELLLREKWENDEAQLLVNDYLDWLSPALLTLPDISNEWRDRLEKAAYRQPLKVDELYHLYPKIINTKLMNQALVEAAIRKSTGV